MGVNGLLFSIEFWLAVTVVVVYCGLSHLVSLSADHESDVVGLSFPDRVRNANWWKEHRKGTDS